MTFFIFNRKSKASTMRKLLTQKNCQPLLNIKQTEKAIKLVKDTFQDNLSTGLQKQQHHIDITKLPHY